MSILRVGSCTPVRPVPSATGEEFVGEDVAVFLGNRAMRIALSAVGQDAS